MKSLLLIFFLNMPQLMANDTNNYFTKYVSAIIPVSEGIYSDNPIEISRNAQLKLGIDGYMKGEDTNDQISIVEGLLRSDFIFLGNIKSEVKGFSIATYSDILFQFEKRKSLDIVKIISGQLNGNFNHLASPVIYEMGGYNMNSPERIRPFKNFNQHSLVATALYSCDAELTNYLMKIGLSDTFAFFKVYNHFGRLMEPGEAVYNHHRIVTPFNNFMSCLSLNGYWEGSEWINYPEGNPIQPYMEAFVKKMITHYLNKPELNLNEFGCYPVIKDYAYENFEWVRKMFTDKYGPDFAERCERNYQAWEDSCKSIDLPNGGRTIKCSLRKY